MAMKLFPESYEWWITDFSFKPEMGFHPYPPPPANFKASKDENRWFMDLNTNTKLFVFVFDKELHYAHMILDPYCGIWSFNYNIWYF